MLHFRNKSKLELIGQTILAVGRSEDCDGLNGPLWDVTMSDILAPSGPDNQEEVQQLSLFFRGFLYSPTLSITVSFRLRAQTRIRQTVRLSLFTICLHFAHFIV